jgi:hypothetical protein
MGGHHASEQGVTIVGMPTLRRQLKELEGKRAQGR